MTQTKAIIDALSKAEPITLGSLIADRRRRRNLSVADLAAMAGCEPEAVEALEANISYNKDAALAVCDRLKIRRELIAELSSKRLN